MLTRTYLHDGNLSPYPFMECGDTPPFPYSCIYAISVCSVPYFGRGTCIVATAAHLTGSSVSVTLAWKSAATGEERQICTLTADHRGYGAAAEQGVFSAWLCAGTVPGSAYGSYHGCWRLDHACVHFVDIASWDKAGTLRVDGVTSPLSEELSIDAAGFLRMLVLPAGSEVPGLDTGENGRVAVLYTDIPEGVATVAVSPGSAAYSMVREINGMSASGENCALYISVTDRDGRRASEASRKYVTFDVTRPAGVASAPLESEVAAGADVADGDGEAVIVTVNGHKRLPSCYAFDDDEALD